MYDLKRLATSGGYIIEVVIYAVINTLVHLPDHMFISHKFKPVFDVLWPKYALYNFLQNPQNRL